MDEIKKNEDVTGENRLEEMSKGRISFEFDPQTGAMSWKKEGPSIPHALLINALECAKAVFIAEQLASLHVRRNGPQGLFMPDGTPFRR